MTNDIALLPVGRSLILRPESRHAQYMVTITRVDRNFFDVTVDDLLTLEAIPLPTVEISHLDECLYFIERRYEGYQS